MTTNSIEYLAHIHDLLDRYFNLEEFRTLCFELGVDEDSLRGEGKSAKMRELVRVLARNGRLPQLITLAQQKRSHVTWPTVPPNFQPSNTPSAAASTLRGNQVNVYGDFVQGNKVGGDQVGGDKSSVGNISSGQGIAIGREAKAEVHIQQGLGGDEVDKLFAPLLALVAKEDVTAVPQMQALKAEVEKGEEADDEKIADLISDIAEATPSVIEGIVNLFTNSIVAKVAGGATKYILKRIRK